MGAQIRQLLTFLDKAYHRKQVVLPAMPPDQLVESFSDYIVQKTTRIRNDLNEQAFDLPPELPELDPDEASTSFTTFGTTSVEDVEKIITSAASGSRVQDPNPMWILKQCKDEVLHIITEIVNLSLTSGMHILL